MEPNEGTEIESTSEADESPELTPTVEAPETTPGPVEPEAGATPATEINPSWVGLRDAIGEDFFEQFARPILTDMDRNANQRITSLNTQLKEYEGYKFLVDQKIAPDFVTQAVQIAQMLETQPEQLYEFLTQHLGKGQEPEAEPEEDPAGEIPPEIQAQLDQLRQFQESQLQAEEKRKFDAEVARLSEEIERETREYITNNPTLTEEDIPELDAIRHQLSKDLQAKGMNRIATLDEAAAVLMQKYEQYKARFGNNAPNTLPTSAGGNVSASQQFDATKASKQDFEAQIVNDLLSLNQR